MRFSGKLFFVLLLLPLAGRLRADSTSNQDEQANQELIGLAQRQHELMGKAAAAERAEQIEDLRPRLQELVFDYERYLRTYPNKVEGYVSYSMLLGNDLLDERRRAEALLLKANAMDGNLPIVKNQLGKYLAEDGKPLEALNYFIAATELAPKEALYHFQVGQLLGAARNDFLKSGEWTVDQIDTAMQKALGEAVQLDPENLPYAYRFAESYYDLANPPWDEALEHWKALEARVQTDVERQMMRLHQANVRLYQGKLDEAESLLAATVETPLQGQKDQLQQRWERLRHPEAAVAAAPTAAVPVAVAAGAGTAAGEKAAPTVPTFTEAALPETKAMSSATVLDLADENPAVVLPDGAPGPKTKSAPEAESKVEPAP